MTEQAKYDVRFVEPGSDPAAFQSMLAVMAERPFLFDDAMFSQYRAVLDTALNKSPCSCGSGEPFGVCCKGRWLLASKAWVKRSSESKEREREVKRGMNESAGTPKGTDWIAMVGVDPKGNVIVGPAPGQEDKPTNIMTILNLLSQAHNGLTVEAAASRTMSIINKQMQAMPPVDVRAQGAQVRNPSIVNLK